jgi:hypothetical protein
MISLIIIFIFSFIQISFSLNNNENSLHIIQNIPVDNNIPLMIQDINRNDLKSENINSQIPFNIPMIPHNNNSQNNVVTDTIIKINITNIDPMCTIECCMGCQIQFPKLLSQKNCITNICKCNIIEEKQNLNNIIFTNNINNTIQEGSSLFTLNNINNELKNIEKNASKLFYWFLFMSFLSYEIYILSNFTSDKFSNEKQNLNSYRNDKDRRTTDYIELLEGDEDLIECLI